MKFSILPALVGTFLSMNAFASKWYEAPIVTTASPTISTVGAVVCAMGDEDGCLMALVATPFAITSSSSITSILLLKEDIQHVEPDAYDFLAGNSKSLALDEIIQKAKMAAPELEEHEDEDIVVLLLNVQKESL